MSAPPNRLWLSWRGRQSCPCPEGPHAFQGAVEIGHWRLKWRAKAHPTTRSMRLGAVGFNPPPSFQDEPLRRRCDHLNMVFFRSLLVLTVAGAFPISAADRELTGRVVDADTGQPVARAHVTLRFYQGGQPAPEVTLL